MADATIDQIAAQNSELAAQNRSLMERLAALESRVPAPEPEPVPAGVRLEFPRAVYMAADPDDESGIDAPGNVSRLVGDQSELESAMKGGWKLQPFPAPKAKKAAKK